ncbi:sugar phosphate isomerase/epimerase family protein [Actinoplanes sp. NPDC023936]|uniref:sugar phosphate isomerase/epimerase family protein n=1 Tax=Actinoplanes sp. NPDC023936 TaxID=3154910 RepID=UPI003408F9BD
MDVIGTYGTLAGPVRLGHREWSTFEWADRCAEASRAGLSGLGIQHGDLEHLLETRSLTEIKQIFDDHGLRFLELEFLTDWFIPGNAAAQQRKELLFEAAAVLGAHHIKVGNRYGRPYSAAHLADSYAALCAEAAQRHDAVLAYEPMPFGVKPVTLDEAVGIVAAAGTPNAGLALDTWDLTHLGVSPDDLRRVPLRYIAHVELSDGVEPDPMNPIGLLLEAVTRRRFPGAGSYDVAGYAQVVSDMGYAGPWGVEVLSTELKDVSLRSLCRRTFDSARHVTSAPRTVVPAA